MKKIIAFIVSVLLILSCTTALAEDGYKPNTEIITRTEAIQFAEELKEMNGESYDSSLRLIVSSNKRIDYLDAVYTATGINDLYVLQFDNESSTKKAEEYYNSLSYVNYVEYDTVCDNVLCEVEDEFDCNATCLSTVFCNIDDAIKLVHKEVLTLPEIKVGICDSGIAKTSFTESRLDGGFSFLKGYPEDGTQDKVGHGTKVAGTVVLNSLNNVRLYSYQIFDNTSTNTISMLVSAIYKAVSDGCRVINCSVQYDTSITSDQRALTEAIDYATNQGCIVVAGAANDSVDVSSSDTYPAKVQSAITVGAVDQSNKLATFSNFGKGVDIYALGRGMSTYTTSGSLDSLGWNGTSAATPIISSIAALLLCINPDLTAPEIEKLLVETGYATSENNITDEHRLVADAYEAVKYLTGKELPQVNLSYELIENTKTGYSDLTFTSDEDATIYYNIGYGGDLYVPFRDLRGNSDYVYEKGTTLSLNRYSTITVCAYAPGKAKSKIEYVMAPTYENESGFMLSPSSKTQPNNIISRCQLINEKVIEVPETIDGYEVQEIGNYCFMGNQTVETIILPKSVKVIDKYAFANCPNLKTVIAPGVTSCGIYAFYQCENLVNVEIPNLTVANTAMFKNCINLETAKLGTITEIDNDGFYGCEKLKLVKTTADAISFSARTFYNCNELTISTPKGSAIETFALQNDIDLLGDVIANGGSIRVTDAGLRFGYQYNENQESNHIDEYGFIYSNNESYKNALIPENVDKKSIFIKRADNRIDHGDYITYNLVFTKIPDTAHDQVIYARAYVCIGGEYFYSDVIEHSFNSIAKRVLADNEIDQDTKDALNKLLTSKEA